MLVRFLHVVCLALVLPAHAAAAQWFVAPGGTGDGSTAAPLGSIQAALAVAQAGDTIVVRPGTYNERIITRRHGSVGAPITVLAEAGRGSVLITSPGEVAEIDHPFTVFDGLVLDSQYGLDDVMDVNTSATGFILRNSEVRRSSRDCVDVRSPADVLIENALIHHCLNAANGRSDAHGIVAGAVKNLTIRNTEIHTFSGDAVQLDPNRAAPGWDQLTIEDSYFWLAPLTENTNGFAAGVVPGENAFDSKTYVAGPRARLVIRNTTASGFGGGMITNMAAFNLKENIDALLDRVTVRNSEIAFRTRGPGSNGGAWVRIQNALVYNVSKAVRYEDDIERLHVFNSTLGLNVSTAFQAASSTAAGLDVRNVLVLGGSLPLEAAQSSNLAVTASVFVNAPGGDYHLVAGATPIDQGDTIAGVATDRDGITRPQGVAFDVGAYEFVQVAANHAPVVDAGPDQTLPASGLLTLSSTFVDPDQGDSHTAHVDWGDGTSGAATVTPSGGGGTVSATHTYQQAGTYQVTVTVSDAIGASGSDRLSVIVPPATLPQINIGDRTLQEGNGGSSLVTLTVTLSSAAPTPVSVSYATADGTAIGGADFTARSGLLTFAPGVTTQTVTVAVTGDALDEDDETFRMVLSAPVNGVIQDGEATITILDNDTAGIRISDVQVVEPQSPTTVILSVRLSPASSRTVQVTWATRARSAAAGADFQAAQGVLTFAPGQVTAEVRVTVFGDSLNEQLESFEVVLSNPVGAYIADGGGDVRIVDDDPVPAISITPAVMVTEQSSSVKFSVTVSLSAPSGRTVKVYFATANGSAVAGLDYEAASGSITFSPGVTSQAISLKVLADVLVEGPEQFRVMLSSPLYATIAAGESTVTIADRR